MNFNLQKTLLFSVTATFLVFSISNVYAITSDTQTLTSSQLPFPNLSDPNRFTSEHGFSPTELEKISPKKQIALGIEPAAVKCRQGLYLVLKYSDDTPACVKESTVETLYERGWGGAPPPCCKK